jgi:hypothetical protein
MNQGTLGYHLKKKTEGQKSRETVPLIDINKDSEGIVIGEKSGNSVNFTVFFFNAS